MGREASTRQGTSVAILGPLALTVEGVAVPLPSRTERALLATLAIRASRPVAREVVAETLWGEELPDGWRQNLNVAVSRLRRRLESAAGPPARELIATVPDGYRLDASDTAVDAVEFEQRVTSARRSLVGGEPSAAGRDLARALSLWRGDPLPELADSVAGRAEASRLHELHREAVDLELDVRLALGEHAAVVARLEAELDADPLRERRWAQLMLALYRTGRPADALRAFHRARAALEEVGLVPTPSLRRLEEAILRHDPALVSGSVDVVDRALDPTFRAADIATATVGTGPPGVGRSPLEDRFAGRQWVDQQREVGLVGRRQELTRLQRAWQEVNRHHSGGVVFVDGDPGTGKTRLAAELAERVAAGGGRVIRVAYAPGAGLMSLLPAVRTLGLTTPHELHPGSPEAVELALEVTRHLVLGEGQPPTLLILDDAQNMDEALMNIFGVLGEVPLPPPSSNVILVLLLTQRGFEPVPGLARLVANAERLVYHDRLEVGPLAEDDATTVVASLVGGQADPGEVDAIVTSAAGNVRALVELARAVAAGRGDPDGPLPRTLEVAYDERLDRQPAEVVDAVLALAVVGPSALVAEVAEAAGASEQQMLGTLERAVHARLLDEVTEDPGRFRFPSPLEHRLAAARVSTARRAHLEARRPRA